MQSGKALYLLGFLLGLAGKVSCHRAHAMSAIRMNVKFFQESIWVTKALPSSKKLALIRKFFIYQATLG
jgi:hypothetical protein